jgi:hypothetical protein
MIRTSANYFFCEVFCRSFLSRCSCYFWPLYCVSIFNLRLLITPLVSSTFSLLSVLASSAVDRMFESRSGKTKDYKIGICCISIKHTALRGKSKYWTRLLGIETMFSIGLTCVLMNSFFSVSLHYR